MVVVINMKLMGIHYPEEQNNKYVITDWRKRHDIDLKEKKNETERGDCV